MIIAFVLVVIAFVFLYRSMNNLQATNTKTMQNAKHAPERSELEKAEKLYAEKNYTEAESLYVEALKHQHKNVLIYQRLAVIYRALGKTTDMVDCLQIITQLSPTSEHYHQLGVVLYENRNYIKAISAFQKSLMIDASARGYVALGRSFQKISNVGKAVKAYERAADLEVNRHTLMALAEGYKLARQPEKQQAVLERLKRLEQ